MFEKKDFNIPNMANVPITEEKIKLILELFGDASIKYNNVNIKKCCELLDTTENTFRKIINHSRIFGILDKDGELYHLSEISKRYFYEEINFENYLLELIEKNSEIKKIKDIFEILLGLFCGILKKKTLIYIFSFISCDRYDKSAISSMTRNLSPIIFFLKRLGYIDIIKDDMIWVWNENVYYCDLFSKSNIVSINEFQKLLQNFFTKDTTMGILRCVSSFENDRYIWAKSSLFKNRGEICNLNGEYIMTVMKKGDQSKYE